MCICVWGDCQLTVPREYLLTFNTLCVGSLSGTALPHTCISDPRFSVLGTWSAGVVEEWLGDGMNGMNRMNAHGCTWIDRDDVKPPHVTRYEHGDGNLGAHHEVDGY